jgi:predicted nucleotidyltransferase
MTPHIESVLAMMPTQSRARVEQFSLAVQRLMGPELCAIVLYGSAVRGGLTPRSDVNVLVVLRSDHTALLRQLHDAVGVARAAARIDVRVLVEGEIARAADVFPIFYDDVRGCHALLFGKDPFANLVIHDEHRRLRVEQELRDARQRLRRLIIDHAFDPSALRQGTWTLVKQIRASLSSLLRLHGLTNKDDLITVLDVIGKHLKVDTLPLTGDVDAAVAADAVAAVLDAAIADVDSLEVKYV